LLISLLLLLCICNNLRLALPFSFNRSIDQSARLEGIQAFGMAEGMDEGVLTREGAFKHKVSSTLNGSAEFASKVGGSRCMRIDA
jgi:hypothetical protein